MPGNSHLSDIERQRRLSARIDALVGDGSSPTGGRWRLESRSDFEAVLVRDRKVRHRLHLALTFVTLGMWALVWMLLAAHSDQPKRKVISV